MICGQCRMINPSDNLFCQNCGTSLEVPERLASPMFTKANTMDNNSILLTRNPWLVRWDLCLPFVLAALVGALLRWPAWGIGAVLVGGVVFSYYLSERISRIVHLSIPVELMDQQIIAYGPANTSSRWLMPNGVLYLLGNGFFYKSISDDDRSAFHHVQLSAVTKVSVSHGMGWLGDWHSLCIEIANERKLRFVVHKSAVWTALLHMVRKA